MGELTSEQIRSNEIYKDSERQEENQEIARVADKLKYMEIQLLLNSDEEYTEMFDPEDVRKKFQLEPSAKAVNLVKEIITQSKMKGSKLNSYYDQVFKAQKKPENNQLLQSLYLISTMQTPIRQQLVRCLARKIYQIKVHLQRFEKNAKKLNISSTNESKVKQRDTEYDSLSMKRKDFRERVFMLTELNKGMKETLSAVIDELNAKSKTAHAFDEQGGEKINLYLTDFMSYRKKLDEWEKELEGLFRPGFSVKLCEA